MFETNLDLFKTRQEELHRQALEYHLIKSLSSDRPLLPRFYAAIGQFLIISGERMLNRTSSAH